MEISIIIPVFKTEAYLARCIASVEAASNITLDFEIIIVLDGIQPECLSIAKSHAAASPRIRIIQQSNQGLGAARNRGLREADGTWIWFIDSDDTIERTAIERIVEHLRRADPDVVALEARVIDEHDQLVQQRMHSWHLSTDSMVDGGSFYRDNYRQSNAFLFVFRRAIFREHDVWFLPRVNMQDSEILPRYLRHVKKVVCPGICAYNYRLRQNSAMSSTNAESRLQYLRSSITVFEELTNFRETLHSDERALRDGISRKLHAIRFIMLAAYAYEPQSSCVRIRYRTLLAEHGHFPPLTPFYGPPKRRAFFFILSTAIRFAPMAAPALLDRARRVLRRKA